MISLIIAGGLLVMAVGLIAKLYLDKTEHQLRIDKIELAVASAVLLLIVVPATTYVGVKMAVNSQVTFNENWGGFEVRVEKIVTPCRKDGSMRHSYKGDPERKTRTVHYTDSKGKRRSRTEHYTVWHDIPYTTEEWTFIVHTTLGSYTVADRNYPENPDNYRYRMFKSVPDVPEETGTPQFWLAAKARLDSGNPGPVTARREYANYILASQNTILKRFSGDIEKYKGAGLLPKLNGSVHSFYFEDRAYFVGTRPAGDWQAAMNRFDGALGIQRQGDLHLVIVDANKVSDPDNYTGALIAYWMSKEFDKDALSKNGIVVVLGTLDGKTVKWARASTGMPEGNEAMLVDIQNRLPGVSLDPASVLGYPKATVVGSTVKVDHPQPQGALEKVLWGEHGFTRVHMGKPGQPGNVGYSYLLREVEPTGGQVICILLVQFLFCCVAWGICIAHGAPAYRSYRRY